MTVQTLPQTEITLQPGEITTSMMFYTEESIIWGDIVHHESILASRILTGVTVPEYITLHNGQILFAQLNYMGKPIKQNAIHIPTNKINAFHLTPPQKDQLDYDPTEPNRLMAPIEILLPPFKIQANMRISEVTTVESNLKVLKSNFITFYDAETVHANNPNMKAIKTNLILVRPRAALFAEKNN